MDLVLGTSPKQLHRPNFAAKESVYRLSFTRALENNLCRGRIYKTPREWCGGGGGSTHIEMQSHIKNR